MQRATPTSIAATGQTQPAGTAASLYAPPDRTIKGPALASRSHTVQILFMLCLNSFLLFMCIYVLPAHLLWRKALKQHKLTQEDIAAGITSINATTAVNSLLMETVAAADGSPNRNIITAFKLFFSVTQKDTVAVAGIRKAIKSTLAAVVLSQGWFVARYKGWWDEAEAMERGDRDEVLKRRKIGIYKRMEDVTTTTFALPIPITSVYLLLLLCGAPITRKHLDTLILSTYLSVFVFFSSCTFLGLEESEWINAFSFSPSAKSTPRYRLLFTQVVCALTGALIGSAGHLLDWEKAWQVYPVPTILGGCLGLIIGNVLGFISYYRAASSSSRRVEIRAKSTSTPASQSKKSKKKKR